VEATQETVNLADVDVPARAENREANPVPEGTNDSADSLRLADAVGQPMQIAPGQDIILELDYTVGTEREATVVHAEIVDAQSGERTMDWTATLNGSESPFTETRARSAGDHFTVNVTVRAAGGIAPGSTAQLRLTSEIISVSDLESASQGTGIEISVAAIEDVLCDGSPSAAFTHEPGTLSFDGMTVGSTATATAIVTIQGLDCLIGDAAQLVLSATTGDILLTALSITGVRVIGEADGIVLDGLANSLSAPIPVATITRAIATTFDLAIDLAVEVPLVLSAGQYTISLAVEIVGGDDPHTEVVHELQRSLRQSGGR
jgi:hypothetical protein